MSSALFVELEADFHARVPVVICKEEKRWVYPTVVQLLGFFARQIYEPNSDIMKLPEWVFLHAKRGEKETVAHIRVTSPHAQEQQTTNEK